MISEPVFPSWIEDGYKKIRSMLLEGTDVNVDVCRAEYRSLSQTLNDFQRAATIYEMPHLSIERLYPYFDAKNSALNFLCKSWIRYFYYQHIYRIKGYLEGLHHAMETGNWLTAFTCLRCLMEETVHFDYFISRMGKSVDKMDQLFRNEGKNLKKGKEPSERWQNSLKECQYQIISLAAKSAEGSNFDWEGYVKKLSVKTGFNSDNLDIENDESLKGINVLTCIGDSTKRNGKVFDEHYEVLSEFCHPNFGSNTFVIEQKNELFDSFGSVKFSHKSKNYEVAARFFEMSCNPIISIFSTERVNICKGQVLQSLFIRLAESRPSILNELIRDAEKR